MKFKLDFDTSHGQFYIGDKDSSFDTGEDSFWTQDAHDDRLAIGTNFIGVGTFSYGHVNGEIDLIEEENKDINILSFDHIVEASIDIPTGILQIFPCMWDTPYLEIILTPETYRIRIYSSTINSVIGDTGDDYYNIEIWKAPYDFRKVLKQFNPLGEE